MAAMIDKKCASCGCSIRVRLADHKRGWGKFCSKTCKGFGVNAIAPKTATASRTQPALKKYYCIECGDLTEGSDEPRCEHHAILHDMGDCHGQWE